MPSKEYGRLRDSADSQEALLEKSDEHPPVRRWTRATVIIAIQTVAIAILLATVALQTVRLTGSETRRRGFSTDFGNLGDLIPFKQQAFINPLRPAADFSALKMEWKEGEPHYTGPPGPEMDQAWDKMLASSFLRSDNRQLLLTTPAVTTFNISGDAAKPAVGKTHQYDDGKYAMGFEVFHALHCINNIRMMMYPENYILNEPKEETELHKAHCLDYLRQYVQCNADLTPFWGDWVPKYRLVLRPYTPHTCRDWSRLTEWIEDNSDGYGVI